MSYEKLIKPRRLFLQWHITEKCNWHCKHCYQNQEYIKKELTFKQMLDVYKQYVHLLKLWDIDKPSISFTGGEPLLRKDLMLFLKEIRKLNRNADIRILSNGSLLTKSIVKKLKSLKIQLFQVSLEGMKKSNDEIRGKGAFDKTIKAIKMLVSNDIKTNVSFTLTKQNLKDIASIVKLCDNLGVDFLGIRRLVPCGRGTQLKKDLLEPYELRIHYISVKEINKKLRKNQRKLRIVNGCEQGIIALEKNCNIDNFCCVVEGRSLAILPNGDVLSCRRLPIVLGNVLKQNLKDIYYSDVFWNLKDLSLAHKKCKECDAFNLCLGGAKCVTYSYFGKLSEPDPQCWKCFSKLPKTK